MRPDLAVQIFKSFILSKLEYGSIIWGHTVYTDKHCKLLEAAEKNFDTNLKSYEIHQYLSIRI